MQDFDDVKAKVAKEGFQGTRSTPSCLSAGPQCKRGVPDTLLVPPAVVYDINGREAKEAAPLVEAIPGLEQ
jgi:hypothetical protein